MANPVLRGLTAIGQFSGRDSLGQFWPYAGVVFALVFALAAVAMPVAMQGVLADMQSFANEYPEAATVERSSTSYSIAIDAGHPDGPQLNLTAFLMVLAAMVTSAIFLLAAAVSRRLHDCNRSALLGLVPVAFLVIGLILFPLMMRDFTNSSEPDLRLFGLLFLNNLLYMVSLLALVIQCAQRGTPGDNRYGAEPIRKP
jgi:uncharacterized membrane protein YhaH (DUF805 family)